MKKRGKAIGLLALAVLGIFLSCFTISTCYTSNKSEITPPAPILRLWYDGWDRIYYNVTHAYFLCNISLTLNDAIIGTVDLEYLQLEEQSYMGNFTLNLFRFLIGEFQVKVVQSFGVPPTREYFVYYSDKKTIFSPAYTIVIGVGVIVAVIVAISLIYRARHVEERRLAKKLLSELKELS